MKKEKKMYTFFAGLATLTYNKYRGHRIKEIKIGPNVDDDDWIEYTIIIPCGDMVYSECILPIAEYLKSESWYVWSDEKNTYVEFDFKKQELL